jgi:hypothetical protein
VNNVNISALHGYHAISMIRKFLGLQMEPFAVIGERFPTFVVNTQSRSGLDRSGVQVESQRDRLTIRYDNGKTAFYDFCPIQYHSLIRNRQLTIQGLRGEIDDLTIRYLTRENDAVCLDIRRIDWGVYNNGEWANHGLMLGDQYIYLNPFPNARLNDDELAIASCLVRMQNYLETGENFYALRNALEDTYGALLMDEALANPHQWVRSEHQPWHEV